MSQNGINTDGRLRTFEKNRYFHGKLMTARDMLAEQNYHADRLNTINRLAAGYGLLCGLDASVTEGDDALEVTVQPGVALDSYGRLITVKNRAREHLPLPSGDEVYLSLTYDECSKESVPIPGSENACEEECCYNRILEIFEITYEEEPPERYKTVPEITFPTEAELPAADGDQTLGTGLGTIARSYWENVDRSECEPSAGLSIFLGAFTRDSSGWTEATETDNRPLAFDNEMLYAAIARHITFDNPHDVTAEQTGAIVSVEGVENPGGDVDLDSPDGNVSITTDPDEVGENAVGLSVPGLDDLEENVQAHLEDTDNPHEVTAAQVGALESIEGVAGDDDGNVDLTSPDDSVSITTDPDEVGDNAVGLTVASFAELEERLNELEERHERDIERLTDRLIQVEHYVMEQSLWCVCGSYGVIAERFDGELAQLANRISNMAQRFLNDLDVGEPIEPDDYFRFLGEQFIDVQERMIEEFPETRTRLFEKALGELRRTFDEQDERDEANVLPVAASQNKVCKAVRCIHPIVID